MTADEIRDQLVIQGIADGADIHGCTQREIEDLERVVGTALPRAYKQFLLAVGHRAGAFLRGTDVFYGQVPALTDGARALLVENGVQDKLPQDGFVFYMHQGYEFGYFQIGEGDDPPIYQVVEGAGAPEIVWSSFTDYLVDMIRIHTQALQLYGVTMPAP